MLLIYHPCYVPYICTSLFICDYMNIGLIGRLDKHWVSWIFCKSPAPYRSGHGTAAVLLPNYQLIAKPGNKTTAVPWPAQIFTFSFKKFHSNMAGRCRPLDLGLNVLMNSIKCNDKYVIYISNCSNGNYRYKIDTETNTFLKHIEALDAFLPYSFKPRYTIMLCKSGQLDPWTES